MTNEFIDDEQNQIHSDDSLVKGSESHKTPESKSDPYYDLNHVSPLSSNGGRTFQHAVCRTGVFGITKALRKEGHTYLGFRRVLDATVIIGCNLRAAMPKLREKGKQGQLIMPALPILSEYCLGSAKNEQLDCRQRYSVKHMKCSYSELGIQPAQYDVGNKGQCEMLIKEGTHHDRAWLTKVAKSAHGRGITYYPSTTALLSSSENAAWSSCNENVPLRSSVIVMEYVTSALLYKKTRKFDVRTWLLIANVEPLVVYSHEGFARVSATMYDAASTDSSIHVTNAVGMGKKAAKEGIKHFWDFEELQAELHHSYGVPEDAMRGTFMRRVRRIHKFLAKSQFLAQDIGIDILPSKASFFHTFACDWIVSENACAHLLECNGYPDTGRGTDAMWQSAVKIVEKFAFSRSAALHELDASALAPRDASWQLTYVAPNQVHTQGIFDEDEGMLGDCGSLKAHFDPDGVC